MTFLKNIAKAVLPFAALSGLLQFLSAREILNPYWVQIFQLACVVAISALGLNLIYGFTGLFSLGHAAFYGVGAYTAAMLTKLYVGAYGDEALFATGVVFLGSLLAGGLAAALLACLVGLPTLRLTSDYLGIATLGFGVIMKVLFDNADSLLPQLGGARGMTGIARLTGIPWAVAALVAAILVIRNLVHSTYGRSLVAIREDEVAAAAMGVDTFRYKVIGFTAGCAFAGVAGGLYAHLYTFLHPSTFDFLKSFDVLMIVVLGGLGNMSGTLVASFAWVFLLEGMRVALRPSTSSSAGSSFLFCWSLPCWPGHGACSACGSSRSCGARCTDDPRGPGAHPALRGDQGPRRGGFPPRAGRARGDHRPQRFREDHAVQRDHRNLPPGPRRRLDGGGGDHGASPARDQPPGDGADLPEHPPLPGSDGGGQRAHRAPPARPVRTRRRPASDRGVLPGGATDAGAGRGISLDLLITGPAEGDSRRTCRTAISGSWRSPAPWRRAPGFSCWTSPRRG